MRNSAIVGQKQRLDALFHKVRNIGDDELQAHWSRYLCVLVSGFIEESVRTVLDKYVRDRSHPEVASFASRRLSDFSNAKINRILGLIGEFGDERRRKVESALRDEVRDAVDSVVANRHLIAHGREVGITYATIKRYYEDAIKAIELVEQEFEH